MLHKVSFSLWLPKFFIWQPFYTFGSPKGCFEESSSLNTETLFQYSSGSFRNNYGNGDNHGKKVIDLRSKTTTQIEQDGIRKKLEAAQIHFLFDVFAAVTIVNAKTIKLYHQLPSCMYSFTHRLDVYSVQLIMQWNQRY